MIKYGKVLFSMAVNELLWKSCTVDNESTAIVIASVDLDKDIYRKRILSAVKVAAVASCPHSHVRQYSSARDSYDWCFCILQCQSFIYQLSSLLCFIWDATFVVFSLTSTASKMPPSRRGSIMIHLFWLVIGPLYHMYCGSFFTNTCIIGLYQLRYICRQEKPS